MSAEMELAVIVPVFNGATTIGEQLMALAGQEYDGSWEVLIVDNGSTDDTAMIVNEFSRRHPDRFRMERAADRHNLSYVRNEGVRHTTSQSVAFCDADDVVGVGWLAGMALALKTHPLVGSRLDYLLLNDPQQGMRQTYQTSDVAMIFGIPAVGGCGLGCHRTLWESLGGNDEQMLAEDTDFSARAHLHAGVTPVLADAVYHYRLRSGVRSEFKRGVRQARSEVQIFKSYGGEDFRPSMKSAAWRWVRAVKTLRHVGTADGRLQVARSWGGIVGRARGSVAYRTRYL